MVLYVYGVVPIGIDHINGNSLDNRIKNLRNVPQTENTKNLKIPTSNTSGVHGVYWSKVRSKWIAGIGICGKTYNLGGFTDIKEAKKVRKDAEKEHGFHENHGRKS